MDGKSLLNWGWDQEAVASVEGWAQDGFRFEGYNVYQLPSNTSSRSDWVKLAAYDLKNEVTTIAEAWYDRESGLVLTDPVQIGTNSGITRTLLVENDVLESETSSGRPLVNGQTYHFAVTTYGYNPERDALTKFVESDPAVVTVVPQTPKPGVRLGAGVGDTLVVTHEGPSTGSVTVVVVDPTALTGHGYEVTFQETGAVVSWTLTDTTAGEVKLTSANQDTTVENPIVDGLNVVVSGPSPGVLDIQEWDTDGNVLDERITPFFGTSLGTTGYLLENRAGSLTGDRDFDRFNYWRSDDVEINFAETSVTWDYSSETVHASKAPFSAYRHKFSTGERLRLFAGYWDTSGDGTWSLEPDRWVGPVYGAPSYEPIYCWQGYDAAGNDISYDPANEARYIADNALEVSANTTWGGGTGEYHYPFITATLFTMYLDGATPPYGNVVMFLTNKPNSSQDTYTFSTAAPTYDQATARADLEKIQVYPNPYYGSYRPSTVYPYDVSHRAVTFSHLPERVVIRIFTLSGTLVRTLEKDDESQFLRWDLLNESGMLTASGLYIAHVEMKALGVNKILKIAVVHY